MSMYYDFNSGVFLHAGLNEVPEDAVSLDAVAYRKLREGLSDGKIIVRGDNGQPALSEADAVKRRQKAIDWIDDAADRIRASDRSVGEYLDAEYQLVAQALIEYRNNPEGEVPDAIRSYAEAEGLTVEAAAEQIAEAAARVQELLQGVRRIRLAGKAAIRDASDDADFMETARPYIIEMENLLDI